MNDSKTFQRITHFYGRRLCFAKGYFVNVVIFSRKFEEVVEHTKHYEHVAKFVTPQGLTTDVRKWQFAKINKARLGYRINNGTIYGDPQKWSWLERSLRRRFKQKLVTLCVMNSIKEGSYHRLQWRVCVARGYAWKILVCQPFVKEVAFWAVKKSLKEPPLIAFHNL